MSLGNGRDERDSYAGKWALGLGEDAVSVAHRPAGSGWRFGAGMEEGRYLGARTSGAFGSDLRSGLVWTSRELERELGGGLVLKASGTAAVGIPHYEDRAIFRASPSVLSAGSVAIGVEGATVRVEQPLRAETGTGTLRLENGRLAGGRRLYDVHEVPLRPKAREARVTVRRDWQAWGGRMALKASASVNAGHAEGAREASVGFAYRARW